MRSAAAKLVALALAAVLAHGLWRFALKAADFLRSPWSRDYGEGTVLAMVQLLDVQGHYFTTLRDYPLVLGVYPPFFPLLNWPFYAVFGPSLFFPRLLSLLATAGLVVVTYRLLVRLTGERRVALALALLVPGPWFVQTWAPLGRVDTWAILLSTLGLLLVLERRDAAGAVAFVLALLTRQNAVAAPAALLAHLALADRRRFLALLLRVALPSAAAFGVLAAATQGRAFLHLFPYTAAADYEWHRMGHAYLGFLALTAPLQLLGLLALVLRPRAFAAGEGRVVIGYWVLNLLGLTAIAKEGAAQNYFLEPWLASLLFAGVALRVLAAARPAWARFQWAALLVAAVASGYGRPSADRIPSAIRRPELAHEFEELTAKVRATDGPILSENLSLLVVNGKRVLVDPFQFLLLVRQGIARPDRLVRDCETGHFALVIVEYRLRELPELADCLDRRYTPWKDDLGPYQALVPRRFGSRPGEPGRRDAPR